MVADEIFQLEDYLIHYYPGTRSGELLIDQAVFNYLLSRAMRVIENSFGVLVDSMETYSRCSVNLFVLIKKIL